VVYINTESQIEKIDKRLKHISYYRAKTDKPFNLADARCLQQKFFDNIYLDIVRHYVWNFLDFQYIYHIVLILAAFRNDTC
jgi:hypothetical protein